MPVVDLTSYDSKPLEMRFGRWTITSQVPDGRALKAMKALMEFSARTAVVSEMATTMGDDPKEAVGNIEIDPAITEVEDVDVAVLALGKDEVSRLQEVACPEPTIEKAAMYALLYWASGESTLAPNAWLQAMTEDQSPKAPKPRPARRRDQKGKKRRKR